MRKKYITILLILIFIIQWGGGNPSLLAESCRQNFLRSRAAKDALLGDEMANQISGAMHAATGEKQLVATKLVTANITDNIPQAETARILVSLASLGHSSNRVTDIIYLSNVITADMPSIIRTLEQGSELEAAYVEMQGIKNEMINSGIKVIVDLFQSANERVRNGANGYTSEEVSLWKKNREKFVEAYNAFKAAKNRFDSVKGEIQSTVESRNNKSRLDYEMPRFLSDCSNAMDGLDAVLADRIALMQDRPSDSDKPIDLRELLNPEIFFAQLKCTRANPERIKQFEILLPQEPVMVKGSRISLLSLVCNLADNAYKYAEARQKQNAKVIIEIAAKNGEVTLSVKDNGEGISAESLRNMQQVFFTTGGTGIGLTESRIFVKGIGGSIIVQSEAGKGSTFIARMPIVISGAITDTTDDAAYKKQATIVDDFKGLVATEIIGTMPENIKLVFFNRKPIEVKGSAVKAFFRNKKILDSYVDEDLYEDYKTAREDGSRAMAEYNENGTMNVKRYDAKDFVQRYLILVYVLENGSGEEKIAARKQLAEYFIRFAERKPYRFNVKKGEFELFNTNEPENLYRMTPENIEIIYSSFMASKPSRMRSQVGRQFVIIKYKGQEYMLYRSESHNRWKRIEIVKAAVDGAGSVKILWIAKPPSESTNNLSPKTSQWLDEQLKFRQAKDIDTDNNLGLKKELLRMGLLADINGRIMKDINGNVMPSGYEVDKARYNSRAWMFDTREQEKAKKYQIAGAMHEAATEALVDIEACANSVKLLKDADFQNILAQLGIRQTSGRDLVFSGALFEKIGFILPLIAQRIKGRVAVILSKDPDSQKAQRLAIERLNQNIPDAQKIILIHPESGMLPQGIRLGNIKYLRLEKDEATWIHDFSLEKVYVTEQMLKAIGAINATISDEIDRFRQSIEVLKQA